MQFTTEKTKSLMFLQVIMAVFVLFAPSLSIINTETAVWAVGATVFGLLCKRCKDTGKIHISIFHFIGLLMLSYSLIAFLWVGNYGGHLAFFFAVGLLNAFFSLSADYFAENSAEGIKRRMLYMLSAGGCVCALINVVYWVTYIVPVAGKERLHAGMGNADFLAVFMFLCIFASVYLLKGNSKRRKAVLLVNSLIMLFVFIMSKSIAGWVFALGLVILYLIRKKSPKAFFIAVVSFVAGFFILLILMLVLSENGKMFSDIYAFAVRHLFGFGGGFETAEALFVTRAYSENAGCGLFISLFASLGFVGVLCAVGLTALSATHFIKLRTWESMIELITTLMIMLLPAKESFGAIILWTGLMAYNEHLCGRFMRRTIKNDVRGKTVTTVLIACVISALLLCQSLVRLCADKEFKAQNYDSAYNLYVAAASTNITDSYSCRMAVRSMRMGKSIGNNFEKAIRLVDTAIKRDRKNIENLVEKAKVYYACEDFENSAKTYKEVSENAIINGKYNLARAKAVYRNMKQTQKGSSEAKRLQEEIADIALRTKDLNYRKSINDIADKAQSYTKGEFISEENTN